LSRHSTVNRFTLIKKDKFTWEVKGFTRRSWKKRQTNKKRATPNLLCEQTLWGSRQNTKETHRPINDPNYGTAVRQNLLVQTSMYKKLQPSKNRFEKCLAREDKSMGVFREREDVMDIQRANHYY